MEDAEADSGDQIYLVEVGSARESKPPVAKNISRERETRYVFRSSRKRRNT